MKYIKNFENHTEYEAFTGTTAFIKPNVSLCKEENEVHYNPYIPYDPYNGHEYVDLGLPSGTKWAKYNVGATSETEYGNYYMYGKGSRVYNSSDSEYGGIENPLAISADTAAQAFGGEWHMPTTTQINELTANTTYTWETNFNGSGINGGKFTSKTDDTKYIFMPAAGYNEYNQITGKSNNGYYLSSISNGGGNVVCGLGFRNGTKYVTTTLYRNRGYSVRGVVG